MPLPHTGQTAKVFASWVDEALRKERHPCQDEEGNTSDRLTEVWPTNEEEEETRIAQGSEFTRTLTAPIDGKEATWTERVQVLQSLALLDSQKTSLEKKLQEAEGAVRELTRTGKGRKVWREENELAEAVKDILHDTDIEGLLEVKWPNQERTTQRYGRGGRPKAGAVAQEEVQTRSQINAVERVEEKIKERQEHRGWRVEVTNAPEERLSFEASVLTYREGAGLERPFHQMKDEPLGIRPRFVRKDAQIQGLTRLVRIALRVLTLLEIVARDVGPSGRKTRGDA